MYSRAAAGAAVSLVFILVGFGHVAVAVPEPEEIAAGKQAATWRMVIHYGSAASALLFGFGYGFVQPESTSNGLKFAYGTCVLVLVTTLALLQRVGGEDDRDPLTYWRRFGFMAAEYGVLMTAAAAVLRPEMCRP